MTVHISQTISNDQVKVRWQEPYTSGALNKKAYVTNPKGVYAGFTVVPGAALGLWIDIVRDPTLSASVAVVNENTGGKYALTFVTENDFSINLATVPGLPAYVNVCLDAQYTIGAATAAQFRVVDDAELVSNPDLIVLARVLVPAAGPIPAINISSAHRNAAGDAIQTLAKPRNNLVFNSGFESDDNAGAVAGWVSTGGGLVLTASTDNARTGTKSMKLSAAGAVTLQANSTVMPAVPGQEYRVGAWMRSTGASPISGGTGAQLRVTFFDKSFVIVGSTIDIDVAFTGGGTTYVERKAHVTAPVGCAHARLDVSFGNCAGVLYVDDSCPGCPGAVGGVRWAIGERRQHAHPQRDRGLVRRLGRVVRHCGCPCWDDRIGSRHDRLATCGERSGGDWRRSWQDRSPGSRGRS
jgi:hypothetical protein